MDGNHDKEFISRAIELNPTDATSHNILGQWCLAFANLSWFEKKAASALFGTPPTATYDEAVRHFHDAENISPGFWKKNAYLLGETYMKMNNETEAKLWLGKAKAVPIKTTEDKQVHADVEKLLQSI
ncbi:regulator of microtubule dynamics protein [Thraustotheca clavata]|uniref:Regulator of microtubule dynamics protein 1 n=1 Tax=Thraustotheca clavata TaxID=74557 RepID=A0A1V9Z599_9STRA|nr:regulator of microtubule dynamics protein [Thraustotheca clavata]